MDSRWAGVYAIKNSVDGRTYIGSSKDLVHRRCHHFWQLSKGIHHNSFLQRAYDKYGLDAFSFVVLEYCFVESLLDREQFYLDSIKDIYNIRGTAGGGPEAGFRHSLATRKKMRQSALKRAKPSLLTRIKVGQRPFPTGKDHHNSKAVNQYTLEGELMTSYTSISEAVRSTGIKSISAACSGRYKTSGGFIWKYAG